MFSICSLLATFFFALSIIASPTKTRPQNLIVWNPKITSPKLNEAPWASGETRNVTWLTNDIPEDKKNSTGIVVLGHWAQNSTSENLDYMHPIASGFPLTRGWVECTMPDHVPAGDDYFCVLFGDSGNTSPSFSVFKPEPKANATKPGH